MARIKKLFAILMLPTIVACLLIGTVTLGAAQTQLAASKIPQLRLGPYRVSTLPAAAQWLGYQTVITDGTTTTDCTIGGGTALVLCYATSGGWVAPFQGCQGSDCQTVSPCTIDGYIYITPGTCYGTLQQAIDACPSNGRCHITVPPQGLDFSTTVDIPATKQNIIISGAGTHRPFGPGTPTTNLRWTGGASPAITIEGRNIVFEQLNLDNSGTGTIGIFLSNAFYVTFRDVSVLPAVPFSQFGIATDGTKENGWINFERYVSLGAGGIANEDLDFCDGCSFGPGSLSEAGTNNGTPGGQYGIRIGHTAASYDFSFMGAFCQVRSTAGASGTCIEIEKAQGARIWGYFETNSDNVAGNTGQLAINVNGTDVHGVEIAGYFNGHAPSGTALTNYAIALNGGNGTRIGPIELTHQLTAGVHNASTTATAVFACSVLASSTPICLDGFTNIGTVPEAGIAVNGPQSVLFIDDTSGTAIQEWRIQNNGSQTLNMSDVLNGQIRASFAQAGQTRINSIGANPIQFNASPSQNSGTAGVQFFGGGATPVIQSQIDSGGNFIHSSASPAPAGGGWLRGGNTDTICLRNFANGGDDCYGVNASDQPTYNGSVLATAGSTTEAIFNTCQVTAPTTSAVVVGCRTYLNGGHTLIRLIVFANTLGLTCATAPIMDVWDYTAGSALGAPVTIANGAAQNDSGAVSIAMTAGHIFGFKITTASVGCGTSPIVGAVATYH